MNRLRSRRPRLAIVVWAVLGTGCQGTPMPADPAPAARRYRDVTTHTPASVRSDTFRLDWTNKPALYRSYPGAETVQLPGTRLLTRPAIEAIGQAPPAATSAAALDLDLLGTILFLTGGVTRARPSGEDIRATASAGALYPNELYVVAGDLPTLAAGVYHYEPQEQRLSRLGRGDWRGVVAEAADDPRVQRAPVTIVITGILWRSAWKYRERAYRHLHWDGGMMVAHLLAAAQAADLPAAVLGAFIDERVDRLVGADGVREATLAVVPLGRPGAPAVASQAVEIRPPAFAPDPLSPRPIDYPEALRYHAASKLETAKAVERIRGARLEASVPAPAVTPVALPAPARSDASLDAVVRRRSSTRHFLERPITAGELAAVLTLPTRGAPADFLRRQPTLLETYVIVNAVDGIPSGTYHYRRNNQQLELLRRGDFRNTAGFLCLDQALGRDASAVLFYLADLPRIRLAFGERGDRLAELEAGLLAGRAYLAAYSVGRGATGLTFYDDEVTRFFSPHAAGRAPLLVVAVGVPAPRWPRVGRLELGRSFPHDEGPERRGEESGVWWRGHRRQHSRDGPHAG
jgi:SagB-type dehydrogenase family enzyme